MVLRFATDAVAAAVLMGDSEMPDQTSHQFTRSSLLVRDWYNCYASGWTQNDITPDAFAHPAKFAKGLIKRIYDHMLTEGYVKPGDKIVDPFGGVALGALYCMRNGLHWRGVELEEKFVGLGRANIDLWNNRFAAHFPNWGTAEIVQGDSRELSAVLNGASGAVSSPPWAETLASGQLTWEQALTIAENQNNNWKQGRDRAGVENQAKNLMRKVGHDYGRTPGQLGAMKEGDIAAVTSPPYAEAVQGIGEGLGARYDPVYHKGENSTKKSSDNGYGETAGNLGNMGNMVGAVTSPPFEDSLTTQDEKFWSEHNDRQRNWNGATRPVTNYGQTPNNIGNATGPTFWQAARDILTELHAVLTPGGYAAFVCGDYIRNGRRVYFGRQWLQLCEVVGFTGVEWIRAWKREPGPIQTGIFEDKDCTVDRVSFFRRLANNRAVENGNGEAVVLNEDVLIVQKPMTGT